MPITKRLELYRQLEKQRKRPLIVYVTSTRQGSEGAISGDAVPEFQAQLQRLPPNTKALDLLLVSVGGDPTVSWRIVSLIRERVDEFAVLVPQAAFSAATLIVLGANEIVMHPNGNLGPTDPQITVPRPGKPPAETVRFGSEDLAGYLKFAKEVVGLKQQPLMAQAFERFCGDVGTVAVGVAARGSQLSLSMGEKLLKLHMKGDRGNKKAKVIAEKLTKDFSHHGYPVNRTEAAEIGLAVAQVDKAVESLMWDIWTDLSDDLKLREPFSAISVLRSNPACAPLFAAVPTANVPSNLPPDVMQQVVQQLLQQSTVTGVPGSPFQTKHAVIESARLASCYTQDGLIFASRQPDLSFKVVHIVERQGWETLYPKLQGVPNTVQATSGAGASAEGGPKAGGETALTNTQSQVR